MPDSSSLPLPAANIFSLPVAPAPKTLRLRCKSPVPASATITQPASSRLGCQAAGSYPSYTICGILVDLDPVAARTRKRHYIRSMIAFSVTLGRIAAAHIASSGK